MKPTAHSSHPLELRVPPLVVMAVCGIAMWLVARSSGRLHFEIPGRLWVAALFAGAGFLCSLLGVWSFRRARTTVNPVKPETTTTLVIRGPYRLTRNPMYLGFLFVLCGEAVWLSNPAALPGLAAFVAYLNRYQIIPEERALVARFGAEFLDYQKRVARWL